MPAFPVVGVGASAGGLEALEAFFGRIEAAGMAFIVVQHLAPGRESHLAEILGRVSRLPVSEARERMAVEPNHVYVIPPSVNLTIREGLLHLGGLHAPSGGGPAHPIDSFLHSLAADCGVRSMGVILSGTGLDGTRGLQNIREVGGLTFAQDPETAKFQGMPLAASAGADVVLAPDAIADELMRISRHPYLSREPTSSPGEEGLQKLFRLIRTNFGTDLSFYKLPTVQRRIERRMALNRLEQLDDYVRLVQEQPNELKLLYRDLLINVTSFFRDSEAFDALRNVVFPRLIEAKKPGDAIRIWIPGCSTGEEAYSIAICLLEALGERAQEFQVQVFATDLDEEAIVAARAGRYPLTISADVSPERLRRFFQRRENLYDVGRRLRELVIFAAHDLTRDAPFSRLDLCSCRNVLIYLQPPLQRRVIRVLHYALGRAGILLLGSSETASDFPDLFSLVDKKNRLYAKKLTPGPGTFEIDVPLLREARGHPGQPDPLRPLANLQQLADRRILERFTPAGVLVNENLDVLQFRGRTGPFLEPQPGTATLNLLKLARPEFHLDLRTATHRALADDAPTSVRVGPKLGDAPGPVTLEVHPLRDTESGVRSLLVLFRVEGPAEVTEEPLPVAAPSADPRSEELERELASTREYLQATIEELEAANEELKSANEELQSSNEELQSSNEELETSKEELQSTNEELTTVNDELENRMVELSVSNDDLVNLLSSVENPVIMVGMDLRLRRLTETAERLFGLSGEDLNRPVSILRPFLPQVELERVCRQVIDRLAEARQQVQGSDGRWFELSVRPYRTVDHVIAGAVISLLDVNALHARSDRDQLEALSVLPTPALALDEGLRITWANDAAVDALGLGKVTLIGLTLEQLGSGELSQPKLRGALERLATEGARFRDLDVRAGTTALRVHGARLLRPGGPGAQLLIILQSAEGAAS
ncbi:MAG TPA: CheR family methyltransferase [Myxococcaceae bacterium]|nr:CheR family methyltransferase [Myxococcaceae bacterium]